MRRAVIADPSNLPRPANRNINQLVKSLLDLPPDESEHEFIVSAIEQLKLDMERHFQSHSGTAEAALNRNMRFVEVIMDPSIRREWLERGMQKNRQVLDATCGHSEQCATNDHLKTFWEKAVTLYNDPSIS